MSKKMMVNATHPEENRVAIVEDGILTELDIEVAGREPSKGNIYKAVVVRVETGLQAAFVDYGAERLGFLQIDEINYTAVKPDYKPAEDGRRPRINELLHRGQEFLVQITKEERGTKGAALTTYLSLAGRYMVLMPGSQTRGVSRKAESDSQRKELKKAMSSLDLAEGVGYIVRTAALDQTREELERDYRYLIRLFESIKVLELKSKAPALIYKESNLMIRSIRDYFTTDMDEVLIDDAQVFKEAKDFFQMVMPDHVNLVKLHQERRPIFSRYQIEDQIETLSRNQVSLPSGGSIVIDPTEALVAIDVNSGKMASEQGVEGTATKTNLEAATEVGRQLRLRDLGGLIVIDFIDMRERKHMRQVEDQLKKALSNDKARVSVGRISKFGLLEMSRQRIKATLTQGSHRPCPHCNGTGEQKSPETQAVALLRKIHASAAKGQVSRVEAKLPMEVAAHLLNYNREELVDMERRYQLQIHIHGNRDFLADQVEIEIQKKEKDKGPQPEFVAVANLPMVIEEETKQAVGEPSQSETAETGTETGKKRRRRRRRKPAGAVAAPDAQATEETSVESKKDPQEPVNEVESGGTSELTTVPAETDLPAKKPQRGRRSSKPKSIAAEVQATVTEDISTPAETRVDSSQAETTAANSQEVVKTKPQRQRSPRKPKAAEATPPASTADAAVQVQPDRAPQTAGQPVSEKTLEEKPAVEAKPRPKPARRPARKPATPAATADITQKKTTEQTSPEQVSTKETPAPKSPAPKKPAPRGRKKSEASEPAQESVASSDTTPVADTKPTQKKTAAKAPVQRATRKAPVKKTQPAKTATAATPLKDQKAESASEEAPKPKRGRPVKKKPADKDATEKD